MSAREHLGERVALVEHALAAAIGDDRCGELLAERAHFIRRFERAAADEDHRVLGLGEKIGGAFDRGFVERGRGLIRERLHQRDLGARR